MATALTGKLRNEIRLTYDAGAELGTTSDDVLSSSNYWDWSVANGTGANEANLIFRDQRTLAASTSENLDLAGVLTDAYGTVITFARIKMIYVKAATANGGNIEIGGAGSNTWVGPFVDASDKVQVPAGGMFQMADAGATGWAVTAGSADILLINNDDGGDTATYDIIIVGASA